MNGFSVRDKLTALSRRDTKSLGDSVERCLVDDSFVGDVASSGLYDGTSHRFLLSCEDEPARPSPKTLYQMSLSWQATLSFWLISKNGRGAAAFDMLGSSSEH
jgi:hypothetical protein